MADWRLGKRVGLHTMSQGDKFQENAVQLYDNIGHNDKWVKQILEVRFLLIRDTSF